MIRPTGSRGPPLGSGQAYAHQRNRIKRDVDSGEAMAQSRALSSLVSNADDAWTLLACCALWNQPLPHSELLAAGNFSNWIMEPDQKVQAPPASAGRRAAIDRLAAAVPYPSGHQQPHPPPPMQQPPRRAGAPGGGRRAPPVQLDVDELAPRGLASHFVAPPTYELQPQPARQQQPQPPARTWEQPFAPPPVVEQVAPTMSRLELPPKLVAEQAAATPRQPAAAAAVDPAAQLLAGMDAAEDDGAARGGLNLSTSKDERAVSGMPRDAALPEQESVAMEPCPHCGRKFAADRLAKHAVVCERTQAKKAERAKKVAGREKGEGGGILGPPKKLSVATEAAAEGGGWKGQSNNLRQAMEYNRKLAAAKKAGIDIATLPPPPETASDERVACPHCSRKFLPAVAERHIPKCSKNPRRDVY